MLCFYDKEAAVDYAKEWALRKNPRFLICNCKGSESASFVSECLFSGCNIMNFNENGNWYYKNKRCYGKAWVNDKDLFEFLINNSGKGPRGMLTDRNNVKKGDIVQFYGKNSNVLSSAVITDINGEEILTCSHGINSFMRPLHSYCIETARYIHICEVKI